MEHVFRYASRPTPTRVGRTERFSKCFIFRCRRSPHNPRYPGCPCPASAWVSADISSVHVRPGADICHSSDVARVSRECLRGRSKAGLGLRWDYVHEQASVTTSMMTFYDVMGTCSLLFFPTVTAAFYLPRQYLLHYLSWTLWSWFIAHVSYVKGWTYALCGSQRG